MNSSDADRNADSAASFQSAPRHTPGPWKVFHYPRSGTYIKGFGKGLNLPVVCVVKGADADARLIAVAPDLLEAAVSMKAWVQHWQDDAKCNLRPTDESMAAALREINAVIAKASGASASEPAPPVEQDTSEQNQPTGEQ